MSGATRLLADARRRRDAARAAFEDRLGRVQGDLDRRGVGSRILDRIGEEARVGLDHAVDVARENKPVVGLTVVAVLLWFMRGPIMNWISPETGDTDPDDAPDESEHDE